MISIVLIDKSGNITDKKVKQYEETELYKKAGFKKADGFIVQTTWENISVNGKTYPKIVMYGKKSGNAGKENQYEFPPPMDTVLCFGTVILVHKDGNNKAENLRESEWTSIYEHLYGGFEDTRGSHNDEDEEEEEEEIDPNQLTKQGYMKDDFIVEDGEEEDEEFEYESELSEDDYFD
tara:strand:+ start:52 stop:585 length:534 start_codon:yes stop_codon:yes gene_type:complete